MIRPCQAADEAAWRVLWDQYVAFYNDHVPEAATEGTWSRLLTGEQGFVGRIAERDGEVCGFSVNVVHAASWSLRPVCYLEDLFVAPAARGQGMGRQMIDDVVALARERGWFRVYWHTRADNAAARALYDKYGGADGFVRYRVLLDA